MIQKTDLYIDFNSNANNHRRLHGGGRGQPIAKAIGLKTYGLPLTVLDATAGLGQDSFVLASLGCTVTMVERVPYIATLLEDAMIRASTFDETKDIIARMHLIKDDAIKAMISLPHFDVIYLDPMFPIRTKSALVKQPMRLLQDIVGIDPDADHLLLLAQKLAQKRVVVKRPKSAPYLNNQAPHSMQLGKANRFDIYMPINS